MRLLTRSDYDGLVCGALLKHLGIIDQWLFVHPKDVQDGKVIVSDNDVLANIPYVEGCGMWFDHHITEITRVGKDLDVPGECRLAPSAARVIYEYFNIDGSLSHFEELVKSCDKVDSGNLDIDDIKNPKDGVLLGFIMDPRTGLGRFREFTVSNYDLMAKLLDFCSTKSVHEILQLPDVQERIQVYNEQTVLFTKMLKEKSRVDGNVLITDLRNVEIINAGNRFLIYSLFPEANVSIWIVDGRGKMNVPIAIGYSVLNRTCKSNIGEICYSHGGGGHKQVGTCQVTADKANKVIDEIVAKLKAENA